MSKQNKKIIPAKEKKEVSAKKAKSLVASSDKTYYILLGIAILIFSYIRLRLSSMPLERDEGEYAYMGQLLLEGLLPYKEAYNMKLPGTYFMYAFIELFFGKSFNGIHIGLWLLNVVTVVFLFHALKRMFNPVVAFLTATMYGFMSISFNFLGFAAHATHFVSLFVAIALYFFSKYTVNKKLLHAGLTGLMFGLAFLMKQQAVFFILFGGMMIVVYEFIEKPIVTSRSVKNILIYSLGAVIPYLLVVLLMVATGAFDKFWFWTFQYAAKYVGQVTMSDGFTYLSSTFQPIWGEYKLFWILFFSGIITVWFSGFKWKEKIFAFLFLICAFLTTCPGFYFRQHYFISFIPAAALIATISADTIFTWVAKMFKKDKLNFVTVLVFVFAIISALQLNSFYYFKNRPEALCRAIYNGNPFTESIPIAKYIKDHTSPKDKIAILGSEPQILFYADRKSVTGYLYTYNMMEIHDYNKKMQHEMIDEIEKGKPAYLVYCNIPFSWLARPNSPKDIFEWSQKFVQENYQVVGLADMVGPTTTNYYWDADAIHQPEGKEYVLVFKRKAPVG